MLSQQVKVKLRVARPILEPLLFTKGMMMKSSRNAECSPLMIRYKGS
ncbi:hypothetical protein AM1_D0005 (plasmid) [Acaryochloris marina MBIC11017]|uniref:Uncharacterized protein n=1 Tax=Acaryochloris marina (strain MBIC 11017) TaxID=329726 RepID=A8ZNB6_ACAM1|nr:hypothetical protein AM1_D0005 [Acaryochloris marina MBIC11017]